MWSKVWHRSAVNCDNRFPNACVSTKIPTRAHKQRRPARQQHRNLFCHKKQGYGDPGHGEDNPIATRPNSRFTERF
ncbi:hypothetical protein MCC02034_14130 [Bifidobacteriaceae bacterium MCC02034]|nr:hypothetical protein MCC02032_02950 [Bifidobacteriaceae bacterium MCC02032]GDZ50877.1 hypothetical protein MCC02034_14130 [Bifidobacteriaceae bacterium MCC02034]GDZ56424.1 hypothetical protein MCC01996_11240 [Bifidobacteriaceae bacterium MCC01996]